MNELTKKEQSELHELETVIERGLSSFMDVGNALLRIREGFLYREYRKGITFKQYCKERFGLEENRAYQLMNGASAVENIKNSTIVEFPILETHVRPLASFSPPTQVEIWRQAVATGKPITAKLVEKTIEEMQHKQKVAAAKTIDVPASDRFEVFAGDIKDVELTEKLDAIITDPPYPGEFLPLWSDLARFAKANLKEGGVLLAMSGQYHLPKVMQMLGEYLDYQWIISCRMVGQKGSSFGAKVANILWKPILVYRNGGEPVNIGSDEFASPAPDKEFHEWGQSVGGYEWQVEKFTKENDLVCDPFLGGGTTAVASVGLNRRFIGFDINPDNVIITKKRLHDQETSKS